MTSRDTVDGAGGDDSDPSFDCDPGRRCTGRDCRPVAESRADDFEPNDRVTTATSCANVADDQAARATPCPCDATSSRSTPTSFRASSSGKVATCETNTDRLEANNTPIPGALTYTASSDETVYLVVGLATKNPSSRHDYQIEVDID